MKISELIELLQSARESHGDLPVCAVAHLGTVRIDRGITRLEVADCFCAGLGDARSYPEAITHVALAK